MTEIMIAFMIFLSSLSASGEDYSTDINDYEVQTELTSESRPVGKITFKAKEGAT